MHDRSLLPEKENNYKLITAIKQLKRLHDISLDLVNFLKNFQLLCSQEFISKANMVEESCRQKVKLVCEGSHSRRNTITSTLAGNTRSSIDPDGMYNRDNKVGLYRIFNKKENSPKLNSKLPTSRNVVYFDNSTKSPSRMPACPTDTSSRSNTGDENYDNNEDQVRHDTLLNCRSIIRKVSQEEDCDKEFNRNPEYSDDDEESLDEDYDNICHHPQMSCTESRYSTQTERYVINLSN